MNTNPSSKAIAFTLILTAVLAAQSAPKLAEPEPGPSPRAPVLPSARQLPARDKVMPVFGAVPPLRDDGFLAAHDDEGVTVSSGSWKARFTVTGPTFVPYLGAQARMNHEAGFRLEAVRVADKPLELAKSFPSCVNEGQTGHVHYDRVAVVERYEFREAGIEQSFHFPELARRGELCIDIAVDTALAVRVIDGELELRGEAGSFRYGRAVAIDGDGDRIAVETRWQDGRIRLVVPGDFVAKADLPLVVDPMIGNAQSGYFDSHELRSVDIAWCESVQRWFVCNERVWSQTDSDVYVRVFDANLVPVGGTLVVDNSGTSWRNCAIAALDASSRCLVVAEVSAQNQSPFTIRGRMVLGGGTPGLEAPFDVAGANVPGSASGDRLVPDVGGDPSAAPAYFTVVCERVYSASDHDIELRQVNFDGTLRDAPVLLDASTSNEHSPRISKSCGMPSGEAQSFAVVYRRGATGIGNGHLRAAIVDWDGALHQFGSPARPHFAVTGTNLNSFDSFDVSSPTEDASERRFMLVEKRIDPATQQHAILATVFGSHSSMWVPATVVVDGGSRGLRSPVVDSDGCRFALAYVLEYTATDDDVHVRTFAVDGSTLAQHDSDVVSNFTDHDELSPAIASRRSGGGERMRHGTAWLHDDGASTVVRIQGYEARGSGGVGTRTTGCGNVTLSSSGTPALGVQLAFQVGGSGSLFGILYGAPASLPIPGCAGCTLGVDGLIHADADLSLTVPCTPSLYGGVMSFQGFSLGGGSCLGAIGLSNTIDVTVR